MKTIFAFWFLALSWASALEVATLHPLMGDWARQVGGPGVKVVDVVKPRMDVHAFRPGAAEMRSLGKAQVILASGKSLELYLDGLRQSLRPGQVIVEVGRTIPSQKVSAQDEIYACCPHHNHGAVDPHWWHNVKHAQRAVKVIEKAFSEADPQNKKTYQANAKQAIARLKALDSWVKKQVSLIPRKQRYLTTAHAAFGYFCKAYGFKAAFVQGLARDGEISSKQLAESIRTLRSLGVKAVFPEDQANPKVLSQIAQESGARLGNVLVADGAVSNYEKMIRDNVQAIVSGLAR